MYGTSAVYETFPIEFPPAKTVLGHVHKSSRSANTTKEWVWLMKLQSHMTPLLFSAELNAVHMLYNTSRSARVANSPYRN